MPTVAELLLGLMDPELSILMMVAEHLTVAGIELLLGHLEPRLQLMVFNKMPFLRGRRHLDMEVEMPGEDRKLQLTSTRLRPMTVGVLTNQLQIVGVEIHTMLLLLVLICQLLLPLQ